MAAVLCFGSALAAPLNNSNDLRTDDKPDVKPKEPACYSASVAFDASLRWDVLGGVLPDPVITETTTGEHAKCKNTLVCSMVVHPKGRTISITAYDKDVAFDDFAGGGTCAVGKSCVLGHVTLSSTHC